MPKIQAINYEWQAVKEYTAGTVILSLIILLCLLCKSCQADEGPWKISFYCACDKCCGKSDGIMASGKKVYPGACACNWLPFGSRLIIDDKVYIVEDRGAKSIFGSWGNHKKAIDIYMPSHSEALRRGIYYTKVKILN